MKDSGERFTFGKEYEISTSFPLRGFLYVDGSGPYEFHIPKVTTIQEALGYEKFFHHIYGDYLYRMVGNQKGNHFHVGITPLNKKVLYQLYLSYWLLTYTPARYIMIGYKHRRFRSSMSMWAGLSRPYSYSSFYRFRSRVSAFITPTRHHRYPIHLEVRASQSSLVDDFLYFALAYYLMMKVGLSLKKNDVLDAYVYNTNWNKFNKLMGTEIQSLKELFEWLDPIGELDTRIEFPKDNFLDTLYYIFKQGYKNLRSRNYPLRRGFYDNVIKIGKLDNEKKEKILSQLNGFGDLR